MLHPIEAESFRVYLPGAGVKSCRRMYQQYESVDVPASVARFFHCA